MSIKISTGLVDYLADTGSLRTALTAGAGKFLIFSTVQPATANDAQSGLIATIDEGAFAAQAVDGVIAISGAWSGVGAADGVAKSFRYCCDTADTGLTSSTNAKRIDGALSEIGGDGDAEIDNPAVVTGQAVSITSFSFGFDRG